MIKPISLDIQLINAVLNYLGTRPYAEVYQMIQAIQAAASKEEVVETKD
jgi:hypothetical protein